MGAAAERGRIFRQRHGPALLIAQPRGGRSGHPNCAATRVEHLRAASVVTLNPAATRLVPPPEVSSQPAGRALAARQRSIEHLDGYAEEIEADDSPLRNQRSWLKRYFAVPVDDNKIRSIVEATRQAGVWNVPTLVESRKSAPPPEMAQAWLKRPEMRYLPPQTAGVWGRAAERITRRMSPEDFERVAEGERARKRLVKFLSEGGARLLLGMDTPNAFVIPSFSVHEELQNLVDAGLTPYQALRSGTRDAAEFMGALDEVGTVSAGKRADLILLEGNPLESVTNTARRAGVMARGRWYPAGELLKQLDALAGSYAMK